MTNSPSTQPQTGEREAHVAPELAHSLISGEMMLGEFAGLSREAQYAIAEIAYGLLSSGQAEQARQIYEGLVAANPLDSVFYCHLAAANHRLGDLEAAFAEYTESLNFNVANVDALVGRSEIYLARGELKEAITDLQRAIQLDPAAKRIATKRARAILVALTEAANDQRPEAAGKKASGENA